MARTRFATSVGDPPFRWVYLDLIVDNPAAPDPRQSGFSLVVEELDRNGIVQPKVDYFEWRWEDILRYPEDFVPANAVWRDAETGETVDIYALPSPL